MQSSPLVTRASNGRSFHLGGRSLGLFTS
jgi:hypothetical protein